MCLRFSFSRSIDVDSHFINAKYVVQRMVGGVSRKPLPKHKALMLKITSAKDYATLVSLFPAEHQEVAVGVECVTKRARLDVDN
jgi:hypothetical protein